MVLAASGIDSVPYMCGNVACAGGVGYRCAIDAQLDNADAAVEAAEICLRQPSYGMPGSKTPTHCSKHKLQGQVATLTFEP